MTPREVAEKHGVSIAELASWRRREVGPPFYNFGRNAIRYDMADVDEWFNDLGNAYLHHSSPTEEAHLCPA
ncbi:helix-turn-helix transcriptional regulator [Arthrobacter sp. D2-10]